MKAQHRVIFKGKLDFATGRRCAVCGRTIRRSEAIVVYGDGNTVQSSHESCFQALPEKTVEPGTRLEVGVGDGVWTALGEYFFQFGLTRDRARFLRAATGVRVVKAKKPPSAESVRKLILRWRTLLEIESALRGELDEEKQFLRIGEESRDRVVLLRTALEACELEREQIEELLTERLPNTYQWKWFELSAKYERTLAAQSA